MLFAVALNAQSNGSADDTISYDELEIFQYELPIDVPIDSLSMLEQYRIRTRSINTTHTFSIPVEGSENQFSYTIDFGDSYDMREDWASKPKSIEITKETTFIKYESPDFQGDTTLLIEHTEKENKEFDVFVKVVKVSKQAEPCPMTIAMLDLAGIDYTLNIDNTYTIYDSETGTTTFIDPNNLMVYKESPDENGCKNSILKFYEQICGKCYVKEQIVTETETLTSGYNVKKVSRTKHDNIYVSDCNEDCFINTPYGKLYEIPCELSIVPLSDCQLTYDFGYCDEIFPVMWKDPNGEIYNTKTVTVNTNGMWYAFVKGLNSCFLVIDSIDIQTCPPFDGSLCSNINDEASGTGDWSSTYISDGDGYLHLIFYTATVPDQLIVRKNGATFANSGYYSSNLCVKDYNDCIGTVIPGCGSDYNVEIPVSANDIIELEVIANNCNANSTIWNLQADCYGEQGQGGNLDFRGLKENDEYSLGNISIYPNPFSNKLTIKAPTINIGYSIEITNSNGQVVYKNNKQIRNNVLEINTESFPSGIYFVNITTEEGKLIKKFIKN